MYDTCFFFRHINSIGGIETFFFELAKQFKDRAITIFYISGDNEQIKRLKKYVEVIQYVNQDIKCKKMFYNYNVDIIDKVDAEEHIQILHGDYKALGVLPPLPNKIDRYISVSQLVADSFKELTGKDSKVIYNPLEIPKPKPLLKLASASRFTAEKGLARVIKMTKILDNSGIPYVWYIFSDSNNIIKSDNVIFMGTKLNVIDYITDCDYLVQLSDNEAYCYSIIESLCVGTPIISTDLPVLKELGVNETNSIILDFDLNNLDVKKIYDRKGTFVFDYIPPKSNWAEEITKNKTDYYKRRERMYKVVANDEWQKRNMINNDTKTVPNKGDAWEVDENRLEILKGKNPYQTNFLESYELIKEDSQLTDISKLKLKELKEIAKNNNIKNYSTMKKAELLKALEWFDVNSE